jgi:hypothetical protein
MKLFELFDAPRAIKEAPKKKPEIPIKEVKYGAWTIKAKLKPEVDGKTFKAMGSHPRNPNAPIGQGTTADEAVRNVQTQIDKHMEHDKRALGASKATIDYNAAFTNQIIKDNSEFSHGVTGVRITRRGGEVVLILCGAEYLDAFGGEVYGTGPDQFTKLHRRMGGSTEGEDGKATTLYSSSLTGKQIQDLGLQPNGRYTLDYLSHDRDYGHLTFKLVFDSIVGDKSERVSMGEPGLNIAVS